MDERIPLKVKLKDINSLPDDYWVLVEDGEAIKAYKNNPGVRVFSSSKGQDLMMVKVYKMRQEMLAARDRDNRKLFKDRSS